MYTNSDRLSKGPQESFLPRSIWNAAEGLQQNEFLWRMVQEDSSRSSEGLQQIYSRTAAVVSCNYSAICMHYARWQLLHVCVWQMVCAI